MGKHHLIAGLVADATLQPSQTECALVIGHDIAKGVGEKMARPVDRMPILGYEYPAVVGERSNALPGTRRIQPDAFVGPRPAADNGTFQQPLGVQHQFVSALAKALAESPEFGPECERRFTPASESDLENAIDFRDLGRYGSVILLDDPIEVHTVASGIAQRR